MIIVAEPKGEPMDDLISRQAAIDELVKMLGYCFQADEELVDAVVTTVRELPSALGTNLAEVGTDTISRQAAIDICDHAIDSFKGQFGAGVLDAIRESIAELPPSEPKTGRWILDRSGAYCCSECMEPCAGYVMMKPRDKFCKMCGSRNEVTE